jgi:hypothetical protein
MATSIIPTTRARDAGKALLSRIGDGLTAVMKFLCTISAARTCAMELGRLGKLSDAELAKLGLRRDEIVQHVFRNHMHE